MKKLILMLVCAFACVTVVEANSCKRGACDACPKRVKKAKKSCAACPREKKACATCPRKDKSVKQEEVTCAGGVCKRKKTAQPEVREMKPLRKAPKKMAAPVVEEVDMVEEVGMADDMMPAVK